MSRTFSARWSFTCACCGVEQLEGTLASYRPDGLLVSVEPDHTPGEEDYQIDTHGREPNTRLHDVMPRGKTAADRCDQCFMVHATGQTECY